MQRQKEKERKGKERRCGGVLWKAKHGEGTVSILRVEFITGGCEDFIWCDPVLFFLFSFTYYHMVKVQFHMNEYGQIQFHSHSCGRRANLTALPTYIRASKVSLLNLSKQTSDLNINLIK